MFIKSLELINTSEHETIRHVDFHEGVNLVVDTEDSAKHNKVGKTTFLKLIDIALGAKKRKMIYFDPETNGDNNSLKKVIKNKKISVKLVLCDDLKDDKKQNDINLEVDLFSRGRHYINDKAIKSDEYRQQLNKALFQKNSKRPSFRQLINSFVRISLEGDNNSFLRNLTRSSNNEYRSIYNFLFGLSDSKSDNDYNELNIQFKQIEMAKKRYQSINSTKDEDEIKQIIAALKSEIDISRSKMNDIVSVDDFEQNRQKIETIRRQYTEMTQQISDLEFKQQRNQAILKDAQLDLKQQLDTELTQDFFNEVKSLVPSIDKTFRELVDFNQQLRKNKIIYFEEVIAETEKKIIDAKRERQTLLQNNTTLIALIKNDQLDEYNKYLNEFTSQQQQLSQQKEVLKTLENFNGELCQLDSKIKELKHDITEKNSESAYMEKMNLFNQYFTPLAKKISGEKPLLTYIPKLDQFPVKITELNDGSSTGTRKSIIAAYDLAYQKFAQHEHKPAPHFVIHDVLENIDGNNLKTIIDEANQLKSQYIIAVLKEKLDSSQITQAEQDELAIIKLSYDRPPFLDKR